MHLEQPTELPTIVTISPVAAIEVDAVGQLSPCGHMVTPETVTVAGVCVDLVGIRKHPNSTLTGPVKD